MSITLHLKKTKLEGSRCLSIFFIFEILTRSSSFHDIRIIFRKNKQLTLNLNFLHLQIVLLSVLFLLSVPSFFKYFQIHSNSHQFFKPFLMFTTWVGVVSKPQKISIYIYFEQTGSSICIGFLCADRYYILHQPGYHKRQAEFSDCLREANLLMVVITHIHKYFSLTIPY